MLKEFQQSKTKNKELSSCMIFEKSFVYHLILLFIESKYQWISKSRIFSTIHAFTTV